jgi:hypothetical protein
MGNRPPTNPALHFSPPRRAAPPKQKSQISFFLSSFSRPKHPSPPRAAPADHAQRSARGSIRRPCAMTNFESIPHPQSRRRPPCAHTLSAKLTIAPHSPPSPPPNTLSHSHLAMLSPAPNPRNQRGNTREFGGNRRICEGVGGGFESVSGCFQIPSIQR